MRGAYARTRAEGTIRSEMSRTDVLVRAGQLAAEGVPFVLATVVAVERPASARRGDRALVTAGGELFGWVGGACSEPIVVREALRALADGEARLVRIGPAGRVAEGAAAETVVAASSCASEGVVEVFVEPQRAEPTLAVIGASPAAETLARLAPEAGWRVTRDLGPGADAVVVATMGHGDDDALEAGLQLELGYVGLVASARRAASVLASLRARGLDEESLGRVRSPAGLDLGPSTQPEIAVAVLAELIAWRHSRASDSGSAGVGVAQLEVAIDPVCGMEVAVGAAKESAVHEGQTYYFCASGCRSRFEADTARYLPLET
jgi:xanthine dehydrogenase accessory factor